MTTTYDYEAINCQHATCQVCACVVEDYHRRGEPLPPFKMWLVVDDNDDAIDAVLFDDALRLYDVWLALYEARAYSVPFNVRAHY